MEHHRLIFRFRYRYSVLSRRSGSRSEFLATGNGVDDLAPIDVRSLAGAFKWGSRNEPRKKKHFEVIMMNIVTTAEGRFHPSGVPGSDTHDGGNCAS